MRDLKLLHTRNSLDKKKKESRKGNANGLELKKYAVPNNDRSSMSWNLKPLLPPTMVLSLLPPTHTTKAGGCGNLGNHNSPQSSWSKISRMTALLLIRPSTSFVEMTASFGRLKVFG